MKPLTNELLETIVSEFKYIQIHLGDLEGERELTHFEETLLNRVNQIIEKIKAEA